MNRPRVCKALHARTLDVYSIKHASNEYVWGQNRRPIPLLKLTTLYRVQKCDPYKPSTYKYTPVNPYDIPIREIFELFSAWGTGGLFSPPNKKENREKNFFCIKKFYESLRKILKMIKLSNCSTKGTKLR